jgi:tetratricopeptide (TPR) repeat protein
VTPERAYEESRAAFERGDHDAALAAIREVLAADPRFPNAHNWAGWVLLKRGQLDEAISRFHAAVALAPDDPVPLANLCNALVAAGREADAIAEAERAQFAGHHWLGWHFMAEPERAIDHLRKAVRWRTWWGTARANLGRALELAHRTDEAYEELSIALRCTDDFDRAFCHERMGAYEARHGWLRTALGSMRAALREDDKRGGARRASYIEGIAWIEQQLRAAGIEPAGHESDAAWSLACEREIPPGFLARDELGRPLADDVIEVECLVRAERWADLPAYLEKLRATDYNKLFDAVGDAERGADRARAAGYLTEAIAIMRLVVDAYRYYASGASSGGEGTARMADVRVKEQKLAELERD